LNVTIQQEKIESIVEYGLHEFVSKFINKISMFDTDIHRELFN